MPRIISFALTTPQFIARTKTVTRRIGWRYAKAGDILQAVKQAQGIPKGGTMEKLGRIELIDVRTEVLLRMALEPDYGRAECRLEGFPDKTPNEFVAFFCEANNCEPQQEVRRIEYKFLED